MRASARCAAGYSAGPADGFADGVEGAEAEGQCAVSGGQSLASRMPMVMADMCGIEEK